MKFQTTWRKKDLYASREKEGEKLQFTSKISGIQIFQIFQKLNNGVEDNGNFSHIFQEIYFQFRIWYLIKLLIKYKDK